MIQRASELALDLRVGIIIPGIPHPNPFSSFALLSSSSLLIIVTLKDHLDAVTVSGFEIMTSVIPLVSLTCRGLVIQNVLVFRAGLMIDDFSLDFHWRCKVLPRMLSSSHFLRNGHGNGVDTCGLDGEGEEDQEPKSSMSLWVCRARGSLSKHAQPVPYPMACNLPDHNAPAHAIFSERGLPNLDIDGGD
ncbi:uncharacterized protein BT62DRAFT_485149 [Guyanagaster necrorhizus]|uniref:Uncharacterized protein n=1 Tax=Guyanagaster necrorhizus TaxID=856835 RepID=A0A9P8AMY9_9AGAR|nr:uncharacterized protein BT62DRAFT_485149 [Guyanagaster necrorhizus MCA 3950]KAG7441365.1 hypothetical protein BT62DRAFT_485149 [Guyanagaster necrorhizus MCA 3950]